MIDILNLIAASLTLLIVAVYPFYSTLMARIMLNQLAEKEPDFGRQTAVLDIAGEEAAMISCIRDLIINLEWTLEQAETLLDEPNANISAARVALERAEEKYGEIT